MPRSRRSLRQRGGKRPTCDAEIDFRFGPTGEPQGFKATCTEKEFCAACGALKRFGRCSECGKCDSDSSDDEQIDLYLNPDRPVDPAMVAAMRRSARETMHRGPPPAPAVAPRGPAVAPRGGRAQPQSTYVEPDEDDEAYANRMYADLPMHRLQCLLRKLGARARTLDAHDEEEIDKILHNIMIHVSSIDNRDKHADELIADITHHLSELAAESHREFAVVHEMQGLLPKLGKYDRRLGDVESHQNLAALQEIDLEKKLKELREQIHTLQSDTKLLMTTAFPPPPAGAWPAKPPPPSSSPSASQQSQASTARRVPPPPARPSDVPQYRVLPPARASSGQEYRGPPPARPSAVPQYEGIPHGQIRKLPNGNSAAYV